MNMENGSNILGQAFGVLEHGYRAGQRFEMIIGAHNRETAFFILNEENNTESEKAIWAQAAKINLGTMKITLVEIVRCLADERMEQNSEIRLIGKDATVYRTRSRGVISKLELKSKHITIAVNRSLQFEQKYVEVNGQPLAGLQGAILVCDARIGHPYLKMRTMFLSGKRIALSGLLDTAAILQKEKTF